MAADAAPFPYLRWARAHLDPHDESSLGLSGRRRPPAEDLPAGIRPPWPPDGPDAYTLWREAVAAHEGLPGPEWVHPSVGTSQGNFVAYVAFARGGKIAVETPAYESLPCMGKAIAAEVGTFTRVPERGWRLDPASLEEATQDGVDLLVLTDLHNPSGQRLADEDLDLLVQVAEAHDAVVLVDEVYRALDPLDRPTAVHRHPRILATNSLTKCYGLWDLRAGWVIGHPSLIEKLDEWEDLIVPSIPPAPMVDAATFLRTSARRHLEATRAEAARRTAQVDAWVQGRDDVHWTPPVGAFTGLLFLGRAGAPLDGDIVAARAWESEGIRVVPGSFFQVPPALRVSYLLEEAALDKALQGLGRALDAVSQDKD